MMLTEGQNHKHLLHNHQTTRHQNFAPHNSTTHSHLNVCLDDCLANESSSEECPERDEEMATCYPSKIKQRIRNLERRNYYQGNDTEEITPASPRTMLPPVVDGYIEAIRGQPPLLSHNKFDHNNNYYWFP